MSAVDQMLAAVEWKALPVTNEATDIPYATHEGTLHVFDLELRVYQLSNGQRVIGGESLSRFFDWLGDKR